MTPLPRAVANVDEAKLVSSANAIGSVPIAATRSTRRINRLMASTLCRLTSLDSGVPVVWDSPRQLGRAGVLRRSRHRRPSLPAHLGERTCGRPSTSPLPCSRNHPSRSTPGRHITIVLCRPAAIGRAGQCCVIPSTPQAPPVTLRSAFAAVTCIHRELRDTAQQSESQITAPQGLPVQVVVYPGNRYYYAT